jgi:DNA-binding MarR family transcriptional regulator
MTRTFPVEFFRSSINFKILHTLAYNGQITRKMSITNITKHMNSTYSQIWKRLNDLENLGLLRKSFVGREKIVTLTPRGEKVAQLVIEIVKILEKRA